MQNRYQKARLDKRNNRIKELIREGHSYPKVAEMIFEETGIKLSRQRIAQLAKELES